MNIKFILCRRGDLGARQQREHRQKDDGDDTRNDKARKIYLSPAQVRL